MKSIIRLFKAVPIENKGTKIPSEFILNETIKRGFLFSPEVVFNYGEKRLYELILEIENEVGLSPQQMNSSFHKSWEKVRDTPLFQLIIEQLVHYITTYGFEQLGIYSEDSIYIPDERLEIPDFKGGLNLTVIKGYTKEEIKEKLLTFLNQGIALKEDTIKDVVDVALYVDVNEDEIEQMRNKETKAILYDYLGKVPKSPIEFLRFVVYKSTNKTLLIKNKATIQAIKSTQNISVLKYFMRYGEKNGLEPLAQIFFRFKPLFLAFRTNSKMKVIVNRIRRLANVHHRPMKEDYLNSITSKIRNGEPIVDSQLDKELARVNTFRKIRLAYALNFRTKGGKSILYKIRNGKGYATDFSFPTNKIVKVNGILSTVLESIVRDVRGNVEGKRIYIPENMVYALPATEKQFTGDLPSGSYVIIPKDMIFGVHWNNVEEHRIDLDLSVITVEGTKVGWDSHYRTDGGDILFSGDMTDAHNGASELFYVAKQNDNSLIMFVNYYNYDKDVEVPYEILVAKKGSKRFDSEERYMVDPTHYMVDPNDVICVAKSKISEKEKILGLITVSQDECRFYFSEINIGKSITSYDNEYSKHSRNYLFNFYTNAISLNEILELAGAKIVTERNGADIDLSPEVLERDTIINLISNRNSKVY